MLQELAPCTCGMLYGSCGGGCGGAAAAASAFSLLLPMAGGQYYYRQCGGVAEEDSRSPYGGGGAAVDCTLSLGTPSTRRAEAGAYGGGLQPWDVPSSARPGGGGGGKQDGAGVAPCNKEAPAAGRLPRRCANCDTMSTPLWRNGPRGPKSLCNACGIRYKKEERRAAAAVAPTPPPSLDTGAGYAYCYSRQPPPPPAPQWGCYGQAAAKSASYAMFDAADDGPCLSWRLNMMPSSPAFAVGERPGLFQYY
ncbi:GATA transcription factor 19-like [Oryza glaberrima]|nr:GATA transcription factor 19-like [Oryza glaberrima]